MLAVYPTQFHPVYARPVVYSVPIARRTPIYPESYMNAELYFALEQYAEQQRVLAMRRAQRKAILMEEHRRRQLNAFQNNIYGRRPAHAPVVSYIQLEAPGQSPPSLRQGPNPEVVSLPGHGIKLYESDYETFRRRKAQQARAEYLNELEQERKAYNEWTKELAVVIGQTPSSSHTRSLNRNVSDNDIHGTPAEVPLVKHVKTRRIDDSDRLRKAAIHNARTRVIEELQALVNEFNTRVSNPAEMTEKAPTASPAPAPQNPVTNTPADPIASLNENVLKGCEPRTEGAKLRRRREIAARAIQKHWRFRLAEIAAAKDALNTINALRSRFEFLQSSFVAPEHLEFREDSEKPVLLFSSDNVPVNTYTHELDKLLSLADGVPSSGNENVRSARRAFVKSVEEALEKVEFLIQDIWNRQRSASSETLSAPISGPENVPIESAVDAAPDLVTRDILVDTSSSIAPPERTMDNANASSIINDELYLQGSSSSGQDATAITMSMGDVNIAKVPEADIATSPVLADVSPNAPTTQSSEDVRQSRAEANTISISVQDVETRQPSHSSDASDDDPTVAESLSHVVSEESEVSLCAGAEKNNNDASIEVHHVSALQTSDTPVPVTCDLINKPNPDEEVANDHARLEAQRGADINIISTINGNGASFPACDLDSMTAISEPCQYPQTNNIHAHTSLLSNDKVAFVSESTQPAQMEISGASNPVAEPGESRNEDVHLFEALSSSDNVKLTLSEAVKTPSEPDLNGALDAVQSVPVVTSSPFPPDALPETMYVPRENEDASTSLDHLFVSQDMNVDNEQFDVVYPDLSSSDSDGMLDADTQQNIEAARSETPDPDVEVLEAKSISAGSDEYELV